MQNAEKSLDAGAFFESKSMDGTKALEAEAEQGLFCGGAALARRPRGYCDYLDRPVDLLARRL